MRENSGPGIIIISSGLTCNHLVAYCWADGCSVQSFGRQQPPEVARSVAQEQRADIDRIVQALGHVAAGSHQTSLVARSGEPGCGCLARARETALSESSA